MKKFLLLALSFAGITFAQATQHSVSMTWVDANNSPTGVTYNVYRASGVCTGTPSFTDIAPGLNVKTFQDTSVTPGQYCYYVTAVQNAVESVPSNNVNPVVQPFAVQITVTVAQ